MSVGQLSDGLLPYQGSSRQEGLSIIGCNGSTQDVARTVFHRPSKNICSDALQSHSSDIPCFDPFLTQELTKQLHVQLKVKGQKFPNEERRKIKQRETKLKGRWQLFARAAK